jgi:non-ribosomal peptide synthetase component E (peptide arylation enzyme)
VALIVVSDADAPLADAERWTYRALDDAVRRVAGGLLAEGFKPGERLMIRMPNTSDYAPSSSVRLPPGWCRCHRHRN